MKLSIDLAVDTKPAWVENILANFDTFLIDHANCERKASAMAMSFVAKYPNRVEIIPLLIETAVEELEHFQKVYQIMEDRNIKLNDSMSEDSYVRQLLELCRNGRDERFLDRLLLASVIECRGAERFKLVYENIEDEELKKFYHMLWAAEAKHGNIFVEMATNYFDDDAIYERLQYFTNEEAKIVDKLEIRAAMH
ncbi:MAG: tRNA-(ms[2]io[6]A)-hydroxylase [Bacteroidetes bacterium]|nr:tRNA-(ms[2]io[6]A)-hydroxylase [Bacteroidota bacterium]